MYSDLPSWPFTSLSVQTEDERARWWESCYIPGVEATIGELTGWRILAGPQGSGKSVALAALEQRVQDSAFIIPYPPEKWVGGSQCLLPQENHFAQMMACAALRLRDYISSNPEKTALLTDLDREFVYWIIEKFLGRSQIRFWLNKLEPELAQKFSRPPSDDFFRSTVEPLDVEGQMDELVTLARRFGYARVVVSSDTDYKTLPRSADSIDKLFSEVDVIQHPGFTILIALPLGVLTKTQQPESSRGRVNIHKVQWESDELWKMASLYLKNALERSALTLEALWDPRALKSAEQWLDEEFGTHPVPIGWIGLTETAYTLVNRHLISFPIREDDFPFLRRSFFARHIRIELDEQNHGLWRGARFFHLSDQQFVFLRLLHQNVGKSLDFRQLRLNSVAKSQDSLHKLVSRTRALIEPVPDEPIYLVNERAEGGYTLKNLK